MKKFLLFVIITLIFCTNFTTAFSIASGSISNDPVFCREMSVGDSFEIRLPKAYDWKLELNGVVSFDGSCVTALKSGTAIIQGVSKSDCHTSNTYVITVNDSESSIPVQTMPDSLSGIEMDVGIIHPYMIVGEYCPVDNPDLFNWKLESDGSISFDGEKIIALKNGEGKLTGIGKVDMRYSRTYIITVRDTFVLKSKLVVGKSKYKVDDFVMKLYDDWQIEDESIISFNGYTI